MKKPLFFICFLISGILIHAQSPSFQWVKQMGGTTGVGCRSYGVAVDVSGNVYTTGFFNGTVDFDPGSGTYTLTSGIGHYDIFVSKLDASGNFVWAKKMGGTGDDIGNAISVDASGNVYTTGYFQGTADFDSGSGTFSLTSTGSNDMFVSKLDASGNFIWAQQMGADEGFSISTDASGNVYTTGVVYNGGDMFIYKLDVSGNLVWVKQMVGGGLPLSVKSDVSGNVYTIGEFTGMIDFDPGVGTYTLTSSTSSYDAFVCKLDASGNFIWAKQMGGSSSVGAKSISLDALGNIYTLGAFTGTADFDPGPGTYTLASIGGNSGFVSKLDPSGNFIWVKQMGDGTNGIGSATNIDLDALGGVYVLSLFNGTVDFDPGPGTYTFTSIGSYADIFISKLDVSGNFVWAKQISGNSSYDATSMSLDVSGNIYMTGFFSGTIDFDPNATIYNVTAIGNYYNAFVQKMSQCLSPVAPINTTTTTNQFICSNHSTTLSATSSGTITWYASATSTTALGTGTLYPTPTLTTGTYTYYAEANTCTISANRTPVTVTVNPLPSITVNSGSVCAGQNFTLMPNGASTYTYSSGTAVVTPTGTNSYSVTGTSSVGCVSSAVAVCSVTVHTLPSISVNSGSVCAGKSFTLTPNGASTYTYSSGNAVVTPTGTNSYSVTGTSSVGCVSSTAAISTVTVHALPSISVTSTHSVLCAGETANLTANGISTYTWNNNAHTNSISITPTLTTTYSISGTNNNGCSNAAVFTQSVSPCTGIKSFLSNDLNGMIVYPNPSSNGLFTLDVSVSGLVSVYDVLGNIVYHEFFEDGLHLIDLKNQPAGIYILKMVLPNQQQQALRLVKQF